MQKESKSSNLLNLELPDPEDYFDSKISDGLGLTTIQGRKGLRDRIIISGCQCGRRKWVLFEDWVSWARMKGNIEDINYPPEKGYRGRFMLLDLLKDTLKKENGRWNYSIEELLKKYKVPGY